MSRTSERHAKIHAKIEIIPVFENTLFDILVYRLFLFPFLRIFQGQYLVAFCCKYDKWIDHHRCIVTCRHNKDKVCCFLFSPSNIVCFITCGYIIQNRLRPRWTAVSDCSLPRPPFEKHHILGNRYGTLPYPFIKPYEIYSVVYM